MCQPVGWPYVSKWGPICSTNYPSKFSIGLAIWLTGVRAPLACAPREAALDGGRAGRRRMGSMRVTFAAMAGLGLLGRSGHAYAADRLVKTPDEYKAAVKASIAGDSVILVN